MEPIVRVQERVGGLPEDESHVGVHQEHRHDGKVCLVPGVLSVCVSTLTCRYPLLCLLCFCLDSQHNHRDGDDPTCRHLGRPAPGAVVPRHFRVQDLR